MEARVGYGMTRNGKTPAPLGAGVSLGPRLRGKSSQDYRFERFFSSFSSGSSATGAGTGTGPRRMPNFS